MSKSAYDPVRRSFHSAEGETEAQEERPSVHSYMEWQVDRGTGKETRL